MQRCCHQDHHHHRLLDGRTESVGALILEEQTASVAARSRALRTDGDQLLDHSTGDRLGCVRLRTNRYSALLPPGTTVEEQLRADFVEICHKGQGEWVFRSREGTPIDPGNALKRYIRPAAKELGLTLGGG